MKPNRYEQALIFVLGVALGTAVGAIIAVLYAPYSGEETRKRLLEQGVAIKEKALADGDDFAVRIRTVTDDWVGQLRAIADDLVKQGKMSAEDARIQIDDLLTRLRG